MVSRFIGWLFRRASANTKHQSTAGTVPTPLNGKDFTLTQLILKAGEKGLTMRIRIAVIKREELKNKMFRWAAWIVAPNKKEIAIGSVKATTRTIAIEKARIRARKMLK